MRRFRIKVDDHIHVYKSKYHKEIIYNLKTDFSKKLQQLYKCNEKILRKKFKNLKWFKIVLMSNKKILMKSNYCNTVWSSSRNSLRNILLLLWNKELKFIGIVTPLLLADREREILWIKYLPILIKYRRKTHRGERMRNQRELWI